MPTGYTNKILEGASFEEFAVEAMRAFGATITMRDEPSGTEIPTQFKPSVYHAKQALKDTRQLREINKMSVEDAEKEAYKEYKASLKSGKKYLNEKITNFKKYQRVLEKAVDFEAPTKDHEDYANFMVEQITGSIDFDCGSIDDTIKSITTARPTTGEEWLEKRKTSLNKSIEYHYKEHAKEISRTNERSKWVQQAKEAIFGNTKKTQKAANTNMK